MSTYKEDVEKYLSKYKAELMSKSKEELIDIIINLTNEKTKVTEGRKRRFSPEQEMEMYEKHTRDKKSYRELGAEYGVTHSTIASIITRLKKEMNKND